MIKRIFVYTLFFGFIIGSAQQQDSIQSYDYQFLRTISNASGKTHESFYKLNIIPELNISYFNKINHIETEKTLIEDEDDDNDFHWNPKSKNQFLLYKNYESNEMYFKDIIAFKFFSVKDSLNLFSWKMYSETKDILGFTCQLAKVKFRGRAYNAWFTSELPIGGPWKFDGLPGMILLVESVDEYVSFEVLSIKSKFSERLNNIRPFENDKKYSWQKFKDLYKKKAINMGRYNSDSSSEQVLFITPRMKIERYIDEEDTDYTADKKFEKSLSESKKS